MHPRETLLPLEHVRLRIRAADLMQAYTNNHEQARRNLVSAVHLLEGQTSSVRFNSLRAAVHLRLAESHARTEQDLLSAWVCFALFIDTLHRLQFFLFGQIYLHEVFPERRGSCNANSYRVQIGGNASFCGNVKDDSSLLFKPNISSNAAHCPVPPLFPQLRPPISTLCPAKL